MNLDSLVIYKKYDPEDVGYGIERLPDQVRSAWDDTRELEIPKSYGSVTNVYMVGMGGSALGPDMLLATFGERLKLPVTVVRDYVLPAAVTAKSLVILCSFSGTTEEVLAAAHEARKRRSRVMALCAGGPLAVLAKQHRWPAYIFTPGDLAKQPRFGGGFMLIGLLGLLERAGLIKIRQIELTSLMHAMSEVIDACAVDVKTVDNPAKTIAKAIASKSVLVVSSEHLVGNARLLQNSINENGKQFATCFHLPELNHHLLEGLTYPKSFAAQSVALMLKSDLYHPRTQKRYEITADLFEQQGLTVVEYQAAGKTRLDEVGEVLQFGSYVAWYLAMENKAITTDIPFVNQLKSRMSKG